MNTKHKWYNEIVALAEGRVIQWYNPEVSTWNDYNIDTDYSPFDHADHIEWRIKPKEPVKKYKVAYCVSDDGHDYEYITERYYRDLGEFLSANSNIKWAVLLEPTMIEVE